MTVRARRLSSACAAIAIAAASACGSDDVMTTTASPTDSITREVTVMPSTTESVPVVKDSSATCLDATLPNITVDDSVAYWEIVFDDQRRQYPDQSFPTTEEIGQQKRDEWSDTVDSRVPAGGDAAFSRDVCGLALLDGALYAGTPLRELRSHAANAGRYACSSVLEQGTAALRESATTDPETSAEFLYLLDSALTHVCPHLADFTLPPNAIPRCIVLTPDPSARPDEGVICN